MVAIFLIVVFNFKIDDVFAGDYRTCRAQVKLYEDVHANLIPNAIGCQKFIVESLHILNELNALCSLEYGATKKSQSYRFSQLINNYKIGIIGLLRIDRARNGDGYCAKSMSYDAGY